MSELLNFIDLADGGRNQGGSAHTFKWVPVDDVESIPFPDGNNINADVVLKSGKAWYTGLVTHNQGELTIDQGGGDDELPFFDLDYSGFLPSQEMNNDKTFKHLRTIECLLIVSDRNGYDRLLGDLDNGMRFTYQHTTGRSSSERNGYSWTFAGRFSYSPYYYKGEADTYSLQQASLLSLLNSTDATDVADDIESSNKTCAIITELLNTYGGKPVTSGDWADVGGDLVAVALGDEEVYALDFGNDRIRIYDIVTGNLDRTVLGFDRPYNLLFNEDKSEYLVSDENVASCRIMTTADDTETARISPSTGGFFSFIRTSNNIYRLTLGGELQELTRAGAAVGSAETISNVPRARTIYHEKNTNRYWIGGDSGTSSNGRVSYYDRGTDTVVNVIGSGNQQGISLVQGITSYNARYYLFCNDGCIVEIDINGTVQSRISAFRSSYSRGDVYTGFACPALFYSNTFLNKISACLLST